MSDYINAETAKFAANFVIRGKWGHEDRTRRQRRMHDHRLGMQHRGVNTTQEDTLLTLMGLAYETHTNNTCPLAQLPRRGSKTETP